MLSHSWQHLTAWAEPVERPPYLLGRGSRVCSGASCYIWEKFSGRMQMYDGCCSVSKVTTKKRLPENWGPIVVVWGVGAHLGLRRLCAWVACMSDRSLHVLLDHLRDFRFSREWLISWSPTLVCSLLLFTPTISILYCLSVLSIAI